MSREIRILVLSSRPGMDEAALAEMDARAETVRQRPGCIQFEHYRSVHDPDKIALVELWRDAESYDHHWDIATAARQQSGQDPASQFQDRVVEFYHRQTFADADGIWIPTDSSDRIRHVRWP